LVNEVSVFTEGNENEQVLRFKVNKKESPDWCMANLTTLYFIADEFAEDDLSEGLIYTEAGMRKRVWDEREDRAFI